MIACCSFTDPQVSYGQYTVATEVNELPTESYQLPTTAYLNYAQSHRLPSNQEHHTRQIAT